MATEGKPTGTIHDLGYKRYLGVRQTTDSRWRVIARQQIAIAWKTWWRFKAALGMAVITTCITGGMMLFASDRKTSLGSAQGFVMKLIDSALPESIIWFCRAGFLVSLTVGATIVASDVQSGAFTFYFARSIRPAQYVVGKLLGMFALLALIVLAGPLVIAGLRLGLSDTTDELVNLVPMLGKAVVIGTVAVVAYAAIPLGFSALVPNRRQALALWAAYYLVFGEIVHRIGVQIPSLSWVAALDLPRAIQAIAFGLFDIEFRPFRDANVPIVAAIVSLTIQVGLALVLITVRVRSAQRTGVGGSS